MFMTSWDTHDRCVSNLYIHLSIKITLGRVLISSRKSSTPSRQTRRTDGSSCVPGIPEVSESHLKHSINTTDTCSCVYSSVSSQISLRWHCHPVMHCASFTYRTVNCRVSCISDLETWGLACPSTSPATPCSPIWSPTSLDSRWAHLLFMNWMHMLCNKNTFFFYQIPDGRFCAYVRWRAYLRESHRAFERAGTCRIEGFTVMRTSMFLACVMYPQLQREIRPFPKLKIKRRVERIDDFCAEDFEICDYNPHPTIKMQMAV